MSARVLLVTRFRDLSRKVLACNRDELSIVHVAWLSDAITRLKQNYFQAILVDLDLPDAKGLEALRGLMSAARRSPILVLGEAGVFEQLNMVVHGAHDYLLKHRFDADTLMRAVHGSIARRAKESRAVSDPRRAPAAPIQSGDAVLSTDGIGLITFLNPVAETLTGWTCAEAAGKHVLEVFEVIEATTRERTGPRMESETRDEAPMTVAPKYILVRRDGHESPIEESAAPLYDGNDDLCGMVVIFNDVRATTSRTAPLAEIDVLNLLSNQEMLDERLKQSISVARRRALNRPIHSDADDADSRNAPRALSK